MAVDTTSYPYSSVVYITDRNGGSSWQASGVLISPDEVLTASHVVWNGTTAASVGSISVSAGYAAGVTPFGTVTAASYHYFQLPISADSISLTASQSDYAVIHLSHPVYSGTMGLEADFTGGTVHVTGYPGTSRGAMVDSVQTVSLDSRYTLLDGTSIGAGSSGGPVWTLVNGNAEVVGLVSSGDSSGAGYSVQITAAVYRQIQNWLSQDDGTVTAIAGTAGNDIFTAAGGTQTVSGGGGNDSIIFHGPRSEYGLTVNADRSVNVADNGTANDGSLRLTDVKYLQFTDKTVVVSSADDSNVARLYQAAFAREPDQAGLNGWGGVYAGNVSAAAKAEGATYALAQATYDGSHSIAGTFLASPEFGQKYGVLSDSQFVVQMYLNALGREPAAAEAAGWVHVLGDLGWTRAMVLVGFAESTEATARIAADWLVTV